MKYGLDCLGLARFDSDAMKAIPDGFALGVFSRTFGDAMPAVARVAGRCSAIRVQLLWSDSHTFSDHDIPQLKAEATRWGRFAQQHRVPVYLSPFCEHNLSNPDKYLKIVKECAPNCEPVNTVWRGALSTHYINEVHGDARVPSGRYIFSYDGDDMLDSDIEGMKARHSRALLWFGWTANFNGKTESDDKTPREKRKAFPSPKLMQSVKYVIQKQKGATNLPSNWLWKSHAEDTGTNDTRINKPVLIAPLRAGAAELLVNGRVISTAAYYGTYVDGRHRYYFREWGFESAEKAGNKPVDLRVGGRIYAKVNPAFRDGSYR